MLLRDMQENAQFPYDVPIKFQPAHSITTTYSTLKKSTWFLGPVTYTIQSQIRTLAPVLLFLRFVKGNNNSNQPFQQVKALLLG